MSTRSAEYQSYAARLALYDTFSRIPPSKATTAHKFQVCNPYPVVTAPPLRESMFYVDIKVMEDPGNPTSLPAPFFFVSFLLDKQIKTAVRPATEPVAKTLERLNKALTKNHQKTIRLEDPTSIEWTNGMTLVVSPSGEKLTVVRDQHSIIALAPPGLIMEGIPAVPSTAVGSSPDTILRFTWFVGEERRDGKILLPTASDVGKTVKLFADCGSGSRGHEVECGVVQKAFPHTAQLPQYNRLEAGQDDIRVTTYNVLCDACCDNPKCRESLYPNVPPPLLNQHYRNPRIVAELHGHGSDVIFLQEVGDKAFEGHYKPLLSDLGYEGSVLMKSRGSFEGVAIFYRRDRFTEEVGTRSAILFENSWETLLPGPVPTSMQAVLRKMTTVGLAMRLRERGSGKAVVVGCTHLYYNMYAPHVRIVQGYCLATACARLSTEAGGCCIVLGGDMNSVRGSGLHSLLTQGILEERHPDWEVGHSFTVEDMHFNFDFSGEDKKVNSPAPIPCYAPALVLPENITFVEANSCYPYTMWSKLGPMVLDYIFITRGRVSRVLPLPPESVIRGQHDGIPNATLASDHLAVIVEVKI